jgi:hypothetical protein
MVWDAPPGSRYLITEEVAVTAHLQKPDSDCGEHTKMVRHVF